MALILACLLADFRRLPPVCRIPCFSGKTRSGGADLQQGGAGQGGGHDAAGHALPIDPHASDCGIPFHFQSRRLLNFHPEGGRRETHFLFPLLIIPVLPIPGQCCCNPFCTGCRIVHISRINSLRGRRVSVRHRHFLHPGSLTTLPLPADPHRPRAVMGPGEL